ncbi:hypothetical protein Tco_0998273 [Tanacetum coccineum]
MLCYLTGMKPYYIQCIKDGPFKPKTTEDDIMKSVISCETTKSTWTNLVHSFEGFVNILPEKWLSFSQGLRNANHTQTLDLADICRRFVYEDNLIYRIFLKTKKALITAPLEFPISTTFFSNNIMQDFQKNSDDEADKRSSEEYLRDLELEFHERALLMKAKLALLEASLSTSRSLKPFQTKNKGLVAKTFDYDEEEVSDDEEMTHVKVLMALADDELSMAKNHARNGEWIDITMKKVNILLSMDEESDWQTYLKYINIDLKYVEEQRLNLLSKYNKIVFELNKCRDDLLALKQAKLEAVTFQIQNAKLIKLNHALQNQLKDERKVNEKWVNGSNKVSQCISEQIPNQKKKILGIEQLTESSSKNDVKENSFIPASLDYDHEMVPKSKD